MISISAMSWHQFKKVLDCICLPIAKIVSTLFTGLWHFAFLLVLIKLISTKLKVSKFQNVLLVSSNFPKKHRNFSRISALAYKKRSSQNKILQLVVPLFFWFDLFFEARAEILKKISLVFWSKLWHQKYILE